MNLYYKLPVFLQNLAISLYGLKREHKRYSGSFRKIYKSIVENEHLNDADVIAYQECRLKNLLINASKTIHYKKVFEELGVDVYNDNPFDILSKMPFLKKDELRGNEDDFVSRKKRSDLAFHTSGSTGTPLTIRMNVNDFRLRMAILEHIKSRYNVSYKSKHITFVGKRITTSNDRVFWRHNFPGHQLVMSVYDLNENNKIPYLNRIKKYNPDYIEGYPSAISIIAKWAIEQHYVIRPKVVFLTAETVRNEQKEIIETAFGCPAVNYYGSSEGAPIISCNQSGCFSIHFESGIIEFVGLDGNKIEQGKPAKMIVTCFTTNTTPLIRYDIGDLAVLCDSEHTKGPFVKIKEILGRIDDVFITKEKGYVGRLSTSLKLFPPKVEKSQIQQLSLDQFKVLIVSKERLTDDEIYPVLNDLHAKLGHISIDIEYVDSIPNGPNGKFRSQVSFVKPS